MITDFFIALGIFSAIILVIYTIAKRYKRCPSDKILVVYGAVGVGEDGEIRSAKCIHGGATFVTPIIQAYEYLDINLFETEIEINALSKYNFPISIKAKICYGINTDPSFINAAAERLLGLSRKEIEMLAIDIIKGQTRVVFATLDLVETLEDKEKLLISICNSIEPEINKVGLKLISFELKDIYDKYQFSNTLTKEIEKSINLKQIGNEINPEEFKNKISEIDNQLENIEKKRTELLYEKIKVLSQINKE